MPPKSDAKNQAKAVHVVGAGLAGSECALQLADLLAPRGIKVVLHEMRGTGTTTPAHRSEDCAELVCSNSFGSLGAHSAPGLLKWEAEWLGSHVLQAALDTRIPAGQALGMDRERFAQAVTARVLAHPNIELRREIVQSIEHVPRPTVLATGPLTHESLAHSVRDHFARGRAGDSSFLYFFDAIAPIIAADSINSKIAWKADRWDRGTKDYWNCPLTKKEYYFFIEALAEARKVEAKDFEKLEETPYFEGCMPIEAILERGPLTLRFGPMSAKGLRDPRTGNAPFAAVQLRQDNKEATAYNMVGFQTKMAYGDQKKVFRLIPGLEEAEFLKLGSIHRNLYVHTPRLLNRDLSSKQDPWLFFAGQITGVEGYFESTCIGLLVARLLTAKLDGQYALDASDLHESVTADGEPILPPRETAFGSLLAAITDETKLEHFQPTNINFGHLPEIASDENFRDKTGKREEQIRRAKTAMQTWLRSAAETGFGRVDSAALELINAQASLSAQETPHAAPAL